MDDLTALTTSVVTAYLEHNHVSPSELTSLISTTHAALKGLGQPTEPEAAPLVPAVPVKKSVTADFLISLETGQKFKSLKRHLSTLGMTPDEYRAKWGLTRDYPMVAASYSAQRSGLAKSLGLGRKPAAPVEPVKPAPKARASKPKAIKPEDETFT